MQPKPRPLSPAEYLDREEKSPVKCEYVDGEVYAMSGAKRAHNLISGTLLARAWAAAKTSGQCQVFGPDMKVHVETHNSFYYPDLSACCDPSDRHVLFISRPCFIVEVMSRSTALIDRREKRVSYTTIETLLEYVMVDSERMRVEVYRRRGSGWQGYLLDQPEDVVESSCLGLRLTLQDIYEGVELVPPGIAEPDELEYATLD